MRKPFHHPKGNSLIEVIIYIALTSVFLIGLLQFSWSILANSAKQKFVLTTQDTLHSSLDRIVYYTKRAKTLGANSVFDSDTGVLELDYGGDSNAITFETYSDQITLPNGSTTTTTRLRMQESGGSTKTLTGETVYVQTFRITDLTAGGIPAVSITLDIGHLTDDINTIYETTVSQSTTVLLRER